MAQAVIIPALAKIGGGSAVAGAVTAASTAAAVGGTAASLASARRARRLQDKADAAASASADLANQRQLRLNRLNARRAAANTIAAGGNLGAGFNSSPVQGGVASIQSTAAGNDGFFRSRQAAGSAINQLASQARGAESRAQTFGAIAQLPDQFGVGPADMIRANIDRAG